MHSHIFMHFLVLLSHPGLLGCKEHDDGVNTSSVQEKKNIPLDFYLHLILADAATFIRCMNM